ncbi:hypothetical protein QQF64_033752 [Cirrhinus molitorella]|uniref:Integrase catalytic domain-containing protein n=1 Tax=Cirrhinus molitorella TaxID=172907 RepID=A0ABR3MUS6_9TELE
MILKNIKPYLASQLHSRVSTVEELIKLGHQLEKDYEQQLRYEGRMGPKQQSTSQRPSLNRPAEKIQVQCWRCSEQHLPGKCPHYISPQSPQSSGHQFASSKHPYSTPQTRGQSSNNSVNATRMQRPQSVIKKASNSTSPNAPMTVPQQLVVPLSIATWTGKAIFDTGASYTLIHESLIKQLALPEQLHPWSSGPLYLANGKAETPLGWMHTTIQLHGQSFTIPAAVLSSQALAYAVVLGLDFIFFSGMQLNVIDQKYSFKLAPEKEYPFQPGNASVPNLSSPQENLQQNKTTQNLSLLSAIPPPSPQLLVPQPDSMDETLLIKNAVNEAHLPPDGKQQLLHILEGNPRVCTLRTGRTDVLQHHIYTTCQVPIKQKPYRLPPIKQLAMDKQLEEMLKEGIVEPSHSATAQNVATIFRREILTRWGVPDFLLSDRGVQFVSAVFRELCENWSITLKLTTAYHPQTNMTERANRNLKVMMAAYVDDNHKKWDQFLPEFRFALNSAIQETTGLSPAELQLFRKLQGPMDKLLHGHNLTPDAVSYDVVHHLHQLHMQAKESSEKAKKRQLRNYNKKRRDLTFKSKDRVWLRNFPQSSAKHKFSAKLAPKWKGPYRVLKQLGPINYQIAREDTGEDVRIANVCNLKMCFPTAEDLEFLEKQKLCELFEEPSEDEEFLGF